MHMGPCSLLLFLSHRARGPHSDPNHMAGLEGLRGAKLLGQQTEWAGGGLGTQGPGDRGTRATSPLPRCCQHYRKKLDVGSSVGLSTRGDPSPAWPVALPAQAQVAWGPW